MLRPGKRRLSQAEPRRPALLRLLLLVLLVAGSARAENIIVTTTSDAIGVDGRCSLREAIQAANTDTEVNECAAGDGADTILLALETQHLISLAGSNEDQNLTGDFDIREDLTIRPLNGLETSSISAQELDRVFEVFDGANLTLQRVHVRDGDVIGFGGAIFVQQEESHLELRSATVSHSEASLFGGGIFAEGSVRLTRSMIQLNRANLGGGIFMGTAQPLTVVRSVIDDNSAQADGGGLHFIRMEAEHSTIVRNFANRHGGGLYMRDEGDASVVSTLVNSTLAINSSTEDGGGVYLDSAATLELYNVTVSQNVADTGEADIGDGGGVFVFDGTLRTQNTVFAGNEDFSIEVGGHLAPDCVGSIESRGYNLFSSVDLAECQLGGDGTGNFVGTIAVPLDAMLGSLSDNGGDGPTMLPLNASVLIDTGDPAGCAAPGGGVLDRDQIDGIRPWDGPDPDTVARCDIGATEAGAPIIPQLIFGDTFEGGNLDSWAGS